MLKHTFARLAASYMVACSLTLPVTALAAAADSKRPHMDLAFCIDTTGSMQGEIDMVKKKTRAIVAKLASGNPVPVVRVGLVAYRDRGDAYVTKVFQLTDDIDKVAKDISALSADGGGDTPESVNEALHVAINDLSWDTDKRTAKLLFLIGDAGPHFYPHDYDWKTESKAAIARGIQINTIACSGLESQPDGMDVFQQIAKLADGKFDTLAYRQEIVGRDGREETVISSAGSAYRIKKGATGDWKSSVSSGMLEKVAAPMAAPVSSSIGIMMAAPAASGGRAGKPMARSLSHGVMRGGVLSESSLETSAASAPGRADSNLDDIVLSAAKSKARKVLNIDYSK